MDRRLRTLALLLLAPVSLSACMATSFTGGVPSEAPHFIGSSPVQVDRDYIDRYACKNGTPLECRCYSLYFGMCDCACDP
jgi:hypothetical protein